MNSTNRALNRLGILLVGLMLVGLGATAVLAAAVPDWLDAWKAFSADAADSTAEIVRTTQLAGLERSWLLIAVPVVCIVAIVLLLLFVFRHGRGHSRTLVNEPASRADHNGGGSVIVEGKVAERALQEALDGHPGVISTDVSTFAVKGTPVLRITANVRRGVSPQVVRAYVDRMVAALDDVLGTEVPVFIQLNAGLATRVASATRVIPDANN